MLYPHSFCGMYFLYISPSQRKNLGFENLFYPLEIGRYFLGLVAVHELRLLCTDWGCFAQIEVAMHRLRLQEQILKATLIFTITWGLYVEAFLRSQKREDQVETWINAQIYIYHVKAFCSEEMANFRVWDRLPMTDAWLNQGGDASMATVSSREVSAMPDFPT